MVVVKPRKFSLACVFLFEHAILIERIDKGDFVLARVAHVGNQPAHPDIDGGEVPVLQGLDQRAGRQPRFAVRAPDRSFLELNWRVRNCSLTEFVFSQDRFTLDSFNHVSHLEDAALHTFR